MGQKILLADDSITIQKVIELTFTDEDFELHTVGNGQKAIEEIRTVKPDIVLCDIIMPEKSGYEVCEHIKTSDDLKHIPVLLLTGAFEPFDQERAKKAGCDGFLAKPFEPQTLISKVKELLESTAGAGASSPASTSSPATNVGTDTGGAVPPPQAPPAAPAEEAGDATVMMSSGMAPPLPPTPTPVSPDATASQEGAGFQENLAVEAGERELSVDSDDRTMFLGQPDDRSSTKTDDIWGEGQGGSSAPSPPASPSPPPESQPDEGQTVMMSSPIVPEPIEPSEPLVPDTIDPGERKDVKGPEDVPGGFTELPSSPTDAPEIASSSPSSPSSDDAWVIPGPDQAAESAEPELTPLGDFGGFDDFSAGSPKPTDEPTQRTKPAEPAPPTQQPEPALPVSPVLESAKDADTTAEPWSEPAPPPAPPAAQPSPPAASEEPFAELSPSAPPATSQPAAPVSKVGFGEASAESASADATPAGTDMDALADRVAKKVLSALSEKVIQEIAWEVVPDLAETLIQKEIEEIKAKIPK
jgi:CheY-like chemotaxis protein